MRWIGKHECQIGKDLEGDGPGLFQDIVTDFT